MISMKKPALTLFFLLLGLYLLQALLALFFSPPAAEEVQQMLQSQRLMQVSQSYTALLIIMAVVLLVYLLILVPSGGFLRPVVRAKLVLALGDAFWLMAAFAVLSYRHTFVAMLYDATQLVSHVVLVLVVVSWFWFVREHYARRRPFWDELREMFGLLSVAALLAAAAAFYVRADAARGVTLGVWVAAFALLPLARALSKALLDQAGLWQRPVLILGTGSNAHDAFRAIRSEANLGYRVQAFMRATVNGDDRSMASMPDGLPLLEPEADLAAQLKRLGNPQIVLALDSLGSAASQQLIHQLTSLRQSVHVIPSIRGLPLFGTELSHFFSHEVLMLTVRNNLARRSNRWIKRAFDLAGATVLLIALAPAMLFIAWRVRQSGASAFYGHIRIGQGGTPFKCLKFRSMRPDADRVLQELLAKDPAAKAEWQQNFKLRDDPRITPIGHFLRRTSLDELPQIINVIRGEMSLVGPRPVVPEELERYGDAAPLYLEAKPGITGLWQVSGRSDTTYAERVSLDAWYVRNWSLWYDIAILLKTVRVVLDRRGAY